MTEQYFFYTFEGSQNFNPYEITVVAHSLNEARQLALDGVSVAAKKELDFKLKDQTNESHNLFMEMLKKIPLPTTSQMDDIPPVDAFIGCWCQPVSEFFEPIFDDPRGYDYQRVPFDIWIQDAPCRVKPYHPYMIKICSCLDG